MKVGFLKKILKKLFKFEFTIFNEDYQCSCVNISLIKKNQTIGHCFLKPFPACCGMVILTEVCINYTKQSSGYGTALVKKAIEHAILEGYTVMAMTVNNQDPSGRMHKIALKLGFVEVDSFINRRTTNLVTVYHKKLR